jgi:FixJ family two-component response regulator
VVQLLASELHRQGVRVETQFGTGCWVMADWAQIEQVALNLILNAAAAMQARPRDERLLSVSVTRTAEGRVVVEVRDSGVGIAPEHLAAVFEPFWTTRREGLGLGLAICRSIVQAHRGTISVAPNPDRGITVRFELEGVPGDETAPVAGSSADALAQDAVLTGASEATVCVVDDDAAVREGLVRLLAAAGFTVASYGSAGEFLERAPLADVACVLLDVQMPGMSGPELQAELAARDHAPPVVFLTGHGDVAAGVDAMKRGAVDFLEKPVDRDRLLAVVGEALERHAIDRHRALERDACRTSIERLSTREREVVAHVIRGRLNKQIAADLAITEQTVKQHRGRVMEKLGVRSVPELVRICEASGLFAGSGDGSRTKVGFPAGSPSVKWKPARRQRD